MLNGWGLPLVGYGIGKINSTGTFSGELICSPIADSNMCGIGGARVFCISTICAGAVIASIPSYIVYAASITVSGVIQVW